MKGREGETKDVPRIRRSVIPPAWSEPYNAAEMRFISIQIILQRFRPDLHQHLHMNLRFLRITRHTRHQLLVFQRSANLHLAWRSPNFAVQGSSYAHTDALFANAVRAAYDEQSAAGFGVFGGEGHGDAVVVGFHGWVADEFGHASSGALALDDFPGVVFLSAFFFEGDAHVCAGFDYFFLRGEGVFWVEIGGIEVADVYLLLFGFACDAVYDVWHKERVGEVCGTGAKVSTM